MEKSRDEEMINAFNPHLQHGVEVPLWPKRVLQQVTNVTFMLAKKKIYRKYFPGKKMDKRC